ncbi:MAG TPA: DinB family protein [Candidatus Aquilonibacter sp.]|nr:DinB family protein [Candidatus Aquilonibacter sp.]
MTPAERKQVIDYLQESLQNLVRTTQALSPTQLQFKPATDRWSAAECLEHIIVVETLVLKRINGAVLVPSDASKQSAFRERDSVLVQGVVGRAERAKSPEAGLPTGRWPHEQLLPEFRAARSRSLEFALNTTANLRQHLSPHPRFGELDCYQWLLLIGAHGERHRAQIEEVLASAESPRAASA